MRKSALIAACVLAGSGVLAACGEPATTPGTDAGMDLVCARNADCSDDLFCNGEELCAPDDPAASARGCIAAMSAPCTGACDEAANRCDTSTCETPDADGDGADSIPCGGGDCDDSSAAVHPGATEVCDPDDLDEDCDPTTYGARDRDTDGVDDAECCNGTTCGTDCDDTRAGVGPTSPEVCNTLDDDCDGLIDEEVLVTCYIDADHDRYASSGAAMTRTCECPVGTTPMPPTGTDVDCDDTLPDVSPGLPEICSNSRDDDCDGTVDEAGNDWYPDCDGDGYGTGTPIRQCTSPGRPAGCTATGAGYVLRAADCDDARIEAHPGASEICNGLDDTCDGVADEGTAPTSWCNEPTRALPHAVAACTAGRCEVAACTAPFLDCTPDSGCETDSASDPARCGACMNACEWGGCSAGECDPVEIGAGEGFTCARTSSGRVACWGENSMQQLGDGTTTDRPVPVAAAGITDARDLDVSGARACVVRAGGSVVCWGGGAAPAPVTGVTGAIEVAVGGPSTGAGWICARTSSDVVCTGTGAPAAGGLTSASEPAIAQIAAAYDSICVLRIDGTVACAGGAFGSRADASASGLPNFVEVAGGSSDTPGNGDRWCARAPSGDVWCWRPALYPDETTVRSTDDAVGITIQPSFVSGNPRLCVASSTGTLECAAIGTIPSAFSFSAVGGFTTARALTASSSHFCARTLTGPRCSGENASGQLGDGTTTMRASPVAVLPPP